MLIFRPTDGQLEGDTNIGGATQITELEGVLNAQQASNLAYDRDNCTRCRAWGVGIRIAGGS
jgi:hypothetical protein